MEEKILHPQAAMIFDIQRFAESITLDSSDDEKKSTTVGNLTYSVTTGTATLTINNTTVTIDSGTVDISGTTKSYTFNVSNGATTTINGVDFLSNGGTVIAFGKNDSTVTLTGAFTIGDGEQTFNLSINNVTYSGAGQISITTNAVTLSGEVTAKNNLTGKTYSLTDNEDLNANFSLKSNDSTKIGNVTYSAANAVELNVVKDKITLVSGTVTVGTGNESLSGKEFSVTSAKATFKPLTDVKINDVTYTAKTSDCTIEVDGNVTLTGKFSITLAAGKSVTINDVKFTADSEDVTFTLNSSTNEVTFTSGSLAMEVNGDLKVNGVTYQDANGTMDFENASTVKLGGDFTVGATGESLSGTTFSTTSGDSTFNASSGDEVKLNGATFTAGTNGLTLEYETNDDSVTIDGNDAQVTGTGHFYLKNDVTINGTEFSSTAQYAELNFTATGTVELSSSFTIGNENQTLNLTVDGITYSGTGKLEVDNDDIKISGSSITVGTDDESLSGKNFTTNNCAVEFNVSEGDNVTINNESYQVNANGSTVSVDNQNKATMSGEFTVEEVDGDKTFTLKENDAITYGSVKYIGKSSDAAVTVNGKTITISAGTVAVENIGNLSEYTFNIASGTTAQINDIDYTKTGSGAGNGDIVFDGDSVTLNSNFTIGDGKQKLNGLKVKLATNVSAIVKLYNLGESGDGEQTLSGDSVEVDGVTYAGTGTITITTSTSAKTATLDGTIAVTGTVTGYNFTLTTGYEYTFGGTTIDAGNISSNISVSGITGDLTSDTVLSSVTIGTQNLNLTAGSGYTINLATDGKISSITTNDSGTFTVDSTTFNVTEGTVTFNLDSDLKITTVTSSDNAKLTVDSTAITLSANDELQKYSNGVWATTPPYDSYVLSNVTIWGVYSTGGSDTVTSVSGLKINGNTATWTGDKSLTVEGTFKVIAGSKTYDIESGGATFTNSGITSVDSGVVKSSSNGIVKLGDNATFKFGDTYTYTETDTTKTSANIEVDANGGVTVTDGTINKKINVGNFIYDNGTYSIGNDKPVFEIGGTRTDGEYLISGGGTSDVAVGSSVNIDGTDITVLESSKYLAKGDTDGGYTAFEGTGTYDVEGGNFTAETNKEYTISGNATYKLKATGAKTGGITTELKTATGTRAFVSGTDSENKPYLGDTYTVTDGVYTVEVTEGTRGTKDLTSGNATYNISSGENFHYNLDNSTREYAATEDTSIEISFGDDISITSKSGAGTRDADGSTDKTTYNNDTYTLDNTAKIKLTLSNGQENFDEGTAKYSANAGTSFHYDNKEYTAKENATLTLTKDNGVTSTALTTGSGTRADSTATTFTPEGSNKTYTTTGGVTYILEPEKSEVVYAASGSRADVNGETYPIGNHTYTLSAGTYDITVADKVGTESLTSGEGTASIAEGITFNHDSKEYTAFSDNVTLNLSVDNSTPTETFSAGKGTRSAESNEKTVSSVDTGNTYTIGDNSKMLLETTGVTFYNGSATREITNDTFKVSGNDNQYTAEGNATLTMTQTAGVESVALTEGNGTREQAATTFEYDNKIYTDTATSGNVTYILKTNQTVEELYSAQGTRDYADGNVIFNEDSYAITGTYSFTLNNGSTSESLTAAGTYSAGNGETFHFGDKTYQGFDGGATLTINYNDKTAVLNSAVGKGTRAAYGNETTAYDNNTYVVNKDSIIKVDITDKDSSEENFYNGTATQTYTSGSGVFHFKNQNYTAQGDATLTLTKTNGIVNAPTLTGNGTRTDNDETFTTTGFADTFTATGNIVYQISDSNDEKVYSAEGTRSFASTDDFKTTYDSDEYTATAGTYSISVVEGAGTQTLSSGSATYTTNNGVFHFKDQTYSAVSETTLTIAIDDGAAKELTDASGVGTRTATTADSNITYTYDSDTYSTNSGSIIKAVVSDNDTVEETFLTGTATYTTNNETFHYDNKAYTAVSNTTITLTYDGTTHSKTFSANSAGTRSDNENKFTYNINGPVYDRTSTDITYLVEGSEATLTEKVFTAKGTRSANDDSFEGNWGNSYTIADGIYSIDVIGGSGNDTVSNAQATNTYDLNSTFNYDGTAYTATNYKAVLSLSVMNNTPTESFNSGSGKNGDDYIIKTKADIGDVIYSSNNNNIVKVNTDNEAITAIDGTITGSFENNEVATIGNINYTAKAASTLQVNSMTDVKVTQGSFEATGNFSTARTINGKALTVTDDTSVKVAFDTTNGITEISNLDAGATVSYSGNATIKTTGDGTYTFDNQTFVIAGDSEPGVTFTMADGVVTKIEGLDRSDSGAYVTVNVIETDTTTYSMDVRTPGENELQRNADGTWTEPTLSVDSYIVTYDGNFKVQAVTNNSVITLTNTDYTVDGTTLTISGDTKPTVVTNSSNDAITVGDISGIENTGGKAVQIDANGNLHIGTQNADGTFTESENVSAFSVSDEGKFSVDANGKITVESKTENQTVEITITDTSKATLDIGSSGTFEINGKSSVKVSNLTGDEVSIIFNSDGSVKGFNTTGSGSIKISKIHRLGFSADLIEYSSEIYECNGSIIKIANSGEEVEFDYTDGKITNIKGISTNAMVTVTGEGGVADNFTILGNTIEKGTNSDGTTLNSLVGNRIRLNSTTNKWTCGLAQAKGGTYTVEIDSAGEIVVKSDADGSQTKNVNDYKAVFGSSTAIKPDYDDDVLPKYGSSITLETGKVTELKISPPGSKSYTINGKIITLTGEATIKPVSNDFSGDITVELKNGVSAIYDGMTFSGNNADVTITIPSSGAISLSADTKISGNPSGKSLTSNSHKIIFENITSGSNITIDEKALTVTDDTSFTVENNVISDIGQDAQISGEFSKSASIVTNSVGTFKVGNKSYVISNDSKVTIGTNSSGEVNAIDDLGGEVTGDFSGEIAVNTKAVQVTGDTDIGVVGDSSKVTKIFNVTGGANTNVVNAGGAETISTDGNGGQFQILSKSYSLSSGTADFIADSSAVTGIKNVGAGVTIKPSQTESNFEIGNDQITVDDTNVTFEMGNGTISGVANVSSGKKVNGLSTGATVKVGSGNDVKINGSDVQITNSNIDYYVYAKKSEGYSSVTGIKNNATITKAKQDAIIIPDTAGTYQFGGGNQTIKTDAKPTFTMGSSNKVSAISGVSGEVALYQDETGLKVLNDTITVKGATSDDAVTLVTGNGSVNQVKNLKGDVNGLNAGAVVNVKTANAVKINSSSNSVQISDTDYTVRATSDGYDLITGLDSGAVVTAAKNASLVATLSAGVTGTYTFGSSQFDISGDENFTFITDANSKLTNIADVSYATISVYNNETDLKINGKSINVQGSTDNPIKVKVGGGGEILGFDGLKAAGSYSLPAGATVEVDTSAGNNIKINNQDLQINNGSDKVTVRAKDDGYDIVSGIKDVNVTTAQNATLVTGAVGTFKFNGQTLKTSDDAQITLQTNASSKVTMVGGLDVGKGLDFYQAETGIVLGVNTLTFAGASTSNQLQVTMGAGDTISTVKNLKGGIKGLSAGASVEVATNSKITLNADSKTLQISNAATNKVTVHTTADGYDSVVGLKNGASVSVAAADVTLTTANKGTFGFQKNGAYITDGDDTISFVTGANSSVKSIYDFNGTISGDFSNAVTINNKTVNVTGDTSISIVGAGGTEGISKITELSNGAVVNNAGGATTISADNAGEFSFKTGATTHKFSLSGTADFLSAQYTDYNPSITGIKNLTSGTVVAYQDEKGLTVGNSIVTISGAAGDYPVSLGITNSTISGVDNLKGEISGLSGGATVNTADGDVTINNSRLNISAGSTAATVYARDYNDGYGYGTIKGFAAGVTFAEAKNTSLVTKAVGEYTFGSGTTHKFRTANDADVTIATDANSKVTAIGGLESASLTIYQDEEDFVINGKTIKIKDVPNNDNVAVSVDAYGNIVGVGNLKGAISNLPTNVSVSIAYSEVTINNSKLKISDGAATVYAKEGNGYGTITGVNSGATIVEAKNSSIIATAAASGQGTYTFGNDTTHKFVMGGASAATVTLATDFDGNVTAVGGMDNNESLAVYQKESGLWIDGKQLQIDNVPSGEAVTLKSNGSKISEVGNLKGLINNLSTNVSVQVADAEVTINGETFKIDKGSSTADATLVTGINGSNTITGITSGVNISEAKNSSIVATVSSNNVTGTYNFGTAHKFAVDGDSDVTIATDANSKVTAIGGLESATLTFYQSEEDFVINGKTIKVKDVPNNDNVAVSVDAYGNIVSVGNLKGSMYNLPNNVTVNVMDSDVTINGAALKIAESSTDFTVISTSNGYDTITGIENDATIATAQNVSIVATIYDASNAKSFTFSDSDSNHKFSITDANEVTIATDHNSKATAIGGLIGTLSSPEEYNVINGASIYSSNTDVSIAAASTVSVDNIFGTVKGANISVPAGVTVQASVKFDEVSADTTFTVNGTAYALLGDGDSIEIKDRTITGLDADARLTITGAVGSFNVNNTELNITTTQNIVIGDGTKARLYDPNDIDFGANTPVEDIVKQTMGSTTDVSSVTIQPDASGNVTESNKVVVVEDANKTLNVSGNSDLIIIEKDALNTTITASGESDTIIVSANGASVTGNKATHVMPTSNVNMTYDGYNHSLNAGLQITNADVIAAVKDNVLKFTSTDITLPNSAVVTMNYDTKTKGIVNFYDIQGEMQKVGYTYNGNNTIDYRNLNGDIVLKGNWTAGGVASTLYGGNGNDTAFGSVGDFFNLGNGSNYIEISSTRTAGTKATIESNATNGDTTVKGFKANDFTNGDVIKIATSEDSTGVTYSGSNLIFTDKTFNTTLSIADMTAFEESGLVGYVNVLMQDINSTDEPVKTSIAKRGMVINVAESVSDISKSYVGDNSGVDFSNLDSSMTANAATVDIRLDKNAGTIGGSAVALRGITSLKGGVGNHTLFGNGSVDNTLAAGEGAATLYGGGSSNDYLIGNAEDDDKKGANTFIYKADGDGNDTIGNFQFFKVSVKASEEVDNTQADRINLDENVDNYIGAEISGSDVVLKFTDGNSLTVKDGVGERFSVEGFSYNKAFSNFVKTGSTVGAVTVLAQVDDNELTYDGFTTNFYAVGENATLNVADTIANKLISIVDDTDSGLIMSGDFRVLNAAGAGEGLSLVGNNYDNTIKASSNGSNLSGGSGAGNGGTNDVLVGGEGADVFYYGYYEGNDTIQSCGADDTIYLYNHSLENAKANINVSLSSASKLVFNTNATLTVEYTTPTTSAKFKLSDGTVYDNWDELKTALTTSSNADIADDWEEIHYNDELLDGEVTFWIGDELSADDNNYLTDDILTGDIQFSISAEDTLYTFSDK